MAAAAHRAVRLLAASLPFLPHRRALCIDVQAVRAATPSCARHAHLNAAGASPPPAPVLERMVQHLNLEAEIGGYAAAAAVKDEHERVFESCATLFNAASSAEIALLDSSTTALARAIYSVRLAPGDVLISAGDAEYAANAIGLVQHARRHGARVRFVAAAPSGGCDLDALGRELERAGRTAKAVCLTHVPTNGGAVYDAVAVGRLVREVGGAPEEGGPLYLLDACQSVGQLPVDVRAANADFAATTSRKWLRGPRGVGVLYCRGALLQGSAPEVLDEPPMLDMYSATWQGPDAYQMRPDARRYQFWESSVAAQLGLGAAVDYALGLGLEPIAERVRGLAEQIRREAVGVRGVRVADLPADGPGGCGRSGIVALDVDGIGGAPAVHAAAQAAGVSLSVSYPSSTPLDAARRQLPPLLRVSAHYFCDESDVAKLLGVFEACASSSARA